MNVREQRGMELAATKAIKKAGTTWLVPSQTSQGRYTVSRAVDGFRCTCPDYELRGQTCKHGYAVEFYLRRETAPDGTVTETRAVRVSYPQDWRAYNAAQTTEKETFCTLLRDLVGSVPEPEQKRGRPSLPIADKLFAAVNAGHLTHAPHYNSVFNVIDDARLTPVLQDLIRRSAEPLKAVETGFAVDSTGFGTSQFYRHFTAKYGGGEQTFRDYVKLHACIGVKTNVITAAEISDRDAHDGPFMAGLVETTAQTFTVARVSADKAYSSRKNLATVERLGAVPFVPFKSDAVGTSDSPMWNRLFHFFHLHRAEFLATYHERSNAESAFSAMKRKFSDNVRSKTEVAQTNEVCSRCCATISCASFMRCTRPALTWRSSRSAAQITRPLPKKQVLGHDYWAKPNFG